MIKDDSMENVYSEVSLKKIIKKNHIDDHSPFPVYGQVYTVQ